MKWTITLKITLFFTILDMVKTTRRVVNVIAKYYEKIHVQTLLRLIEFATFGLAALLARPLLVYNYRAL